MPPYMQTPAPPPPIRTAHKHAKQQADTPLSKHEIQHLRTYLRLKYLELHEEHLEYVRRVIEKQLGTDALFAEPATSKQAL